MFYQVRAGDYMELLGQRFFMTQSQLRLLNPDVSEVCPLASFWGVGVEYERSGDVGVRAYI